MSKKFAKILGGLAAVGAAAAGIFYWYKKKNSEEDFEDALTFKIALMVADQRKYGNSSAMRFKKKENN